MDRFDLIPLTGALDGKVVQLDNDELTVGLLEAMESGYITRLLDAYALIFVAADIAGWPALNTEPTAETRAQVRKCLSRMKKSGLESLTVGVKAAFAADKS